MDWYWDKERIWVVFVMFPEKNIHCITEHWAECPRMRRIFRMVDHNTTYLCRIIYPPSPSLRLKKRKQKTIKPGLLDPVVRNFPSHFSFHCNLEWKRFLPIEALTFVISVGSTRMRTGRDAQENGHASYHMHIVKLRIRHVNFCRRGGFGDYGSQRIGSGDRKKRIMYVV